MSKHTQHHYPNGEVGNNFQVFSHLSITIFRKKFSDAASKNFFAADIQAKSAFAEESTYSVVL